MRIDFVDKVAWRIARQRRFAEMRIGREEIGRCRAGIGEIASSATGHQDLLADAIRVFDHANAFATPSGRQRTHQSGSTATDDGDIDAIRHRSATARLGAHARLWIDADHRIATENLHMAILDQALQAQASLGKGSECVNDTHRDIEHGQIL